jgi:hypothetical protein
MDSTIYLSPESFEWFIGGQAFLRSHDLAPPPVSNLSLFLSLPVCSRSSLLTRERGEGRGTKSCDREKAWSSINHSILSVFHYVTHLGFSWNWFILDWTNIHHHLLCNIKLRKNYASLQGQSDTKCMNTKKTVLKIVYKITFYRYKNKNTFPWIKQFFRQYCFTKLRLGSDLFMIF